MFNCFSLQHLASKSDAEILQLLEDGKVGHRLLEKELHPDLQRAVRLRRQYIGMSRKRKRKRPGEEEEEAESKRERDREGKGRRRKGSGEEDEN